MKKIADLKRKLQQAGSVDEKISVLDQEPAVISFLKKQGPRFPFLLQGDRDRELVVKQLIAIGQVDKILGDAATFQAQIEKLLKVELFYREMGGILGYHEKVLSLLKQGPTPSSSSSLYHSPSFLDISAPTEAVEEMIAWGIEGLAELAELYPLSTAPPLLPFI